jgi:hypothetical protein
MTKIQRLEKQIEADARIFREITQALEGLRSGALGEHAYPRAVGAIEAAMERAEFGQPPGSRD